MYHYVVTLTDAERDVLKYLVYQGIIDARRLADITQKPRDVHTLNILRAAAESLLQARQVSGTI